jgi:hypothetical protein
LNASQTLKYAAQFGNDSGHSAEPDKFKGYRFAARHEPKDGLTAEAMFGHSHRANDADRTTAQVFAAYRAANGRAGAQYSFQRRRAPSTTTVADVDLRILSGFGVLDLKPQKFSVFLRADRYADPCPDCAGIDYLPIATSHPFTMTLAGVEYFVHPAVRISPNIEWIAYGGDAAAKPVDNAIARLTFYWTF